MKKQIIAFIMLGWAMNAAAQQNVSRSPEQVASRFSNRLSKDLTLSADQKTKIYNITFSKEKSIQDVKAQYADDSKTGHAKIKFIRTSFDSEVRSLLSQEQLTKWDLLKNERKSKHKQSGDSLK